MSLRALGRQFSGAIKSGVEKLKEINEYDKAKLRDAPLFTEYVHFEDPYKEQKP